MSRRRAEEESGKFLVSGRRAEEEESKVLLSGRRAEEEGVRFYTVRKKNLTLSKYLLRC